MAKLIAGDGLSIIRITVKDNGTPVDLTGAAIVMNYRIGGGSLLTTGGWTINSPATAGVTQFQFANGTLTAGQLVGELQITMAGKIGKTSKIYIDIEAAV